MAVDMFLKIKDIPGESTDSKHKDEIQIESWSFGESNPATFSGGGGGGAGKVQMQDFHFAMKTSKASPVLFLSCASGKHIQDAILTARSGDNDQVEFMKWTLSDVLVTSYQVAGSADADVPMDQISLNFAKIEYDWTTRDEKGRAGTTTSAGWDLRENVKL